MGFNAERADDISNYAGGVAPSHCRTAGHLPIVLTVLRPFQPMEHLLGFPGKSAIDKRNALEMLTPSEDSSRRSVRDSVPSVLGWKCNAALEHWMRNECDMLVATR